MSAPFTVILRGETSRLVARNAVMQAPSGCVLKIEKPKRTLLQNDRLHAMIADVASQVQWAGAKRNVEAWKDIFTAALRSANHGLDVVPGINGGFVLLGMHTSDMKKQEVSDLMMLIEAFGAEHGVHFNEPANEAA